MLTAKDLPLAPLYLYQAKHVKKTTPRLPEPDGERAGITLLEKATSNIANDPTCNDKFNVLIVGDSAGAGVGVDTQDEAFLGQFIAALVQQPNIQQQFQQIHWQLHATTGDTSFDLLQRLYAMPARAYQQPIDVAVISLGVNDVTARTPIAQWQANIQAIIDVLQRKFTARHIIFTNVPPMQRMPALPRPLNTLLGKMATRLDNALQRQCQAHQTDKSKNSLIHADNSVHYSLLKFDTTAIDDKSLFAKDGFHPSAITYYHWAQNLAKKVNGFYAQSIKLIEF